MAPGARAMRLARARRLIVATHRREGPGEGIRPGPRGARLLLFVVLLVLLVRFRRVRRRVSGRGGVGFVSFRRLLRRGLDRLWSLWSLERRRVLRGALRAAQPAPGTSRARRRGRQGRCRRRRGGEGAEAGVGRARLLLLLLLLFLLPGGIRGGLRRSRVRRDVGGATSRDGRARRLGLDVRPRVRRDVGVVRACDSFGGQPGRRVAAERRSSSSSSSSSSSEWTLATAALGAAIAGSVPASSPHFRVSLVALDAMLASSESTRPEDGAAMSAPLLALATSAAVDDASGGSSHQNGDVLARLFARAALECPRDDVALLAATRALEAARDAIYAGGGVSPAGGGGGSRRRRDRVPRRRRRQSGGSQRRRRRCRRRFHRRRRRGAARGVRGARRRRGDAGARENSGESVG